MDAGQKVCPSCRAEVSEGPHNCHNCGWDLTQPAPRETKALEAPQVAPAPRAPAAPDIIFLDPLPSGSTQVVAPGPAVAKASHAEAAAGPEAAKAGPPATPPSGGRPHSPGVALLCALLIPGAGQAYNGRPIRGFFVLFLTPLILPWLLSLWGAWSTAGRMRAEGGRFGAGGFLWVFLQLWLACNVGLATLIGLTIAGVVR